LEVLRPSNRSCGVEKPSLRRRCGQLVYSGLQSHIAGPSITELVLRPAGELDDEHFETGHLACLGSQDARYTVIDGSLWMQKLQLSYSLIISIIQTLLAQRPSSL
jgi:hypothetical protein